MRRVMWEWNVRVHDFDGQVEAAAAGGFDVLTLPYRKYIAERAAGRSAEDLVGAAKNRGVAVDYLDGMSGWAPIRYPSGSDEFLKQALDFGPDEAFELCARTGIRHIVAIAGFEAGAIGTDELVKCFADFCDRAARNGIQVDLEAMPMLGLPTLAHAWEIVRRAGRPNSSILLDTWHFMRGGADFDLLESLPRGAIVNVQIVDGLASPPSADLWEDATHNRDFPGRGALPIRRILDILARTQDLEAIGPEALSDRVDLLSPEQLGREARKALDQAAAESGLLPASNVEAD